MGVCCSKGTGITVENGTDDSNEHRDDREAEVRDTNDGAIIRSRGSSKHVSMAIKQGKKGINQDDMTVWEVTRLFSFSGANICNHYLLCSLSIFLHIV